jgi:hypothetical protein
LHRRRRNRDQSGFNYIFQPEFLQITMFEFI